MTRWCPSYSCRYDCIFVNVETKIMAKDEENIMIILVLLSFLAVNQPTYRILREGYFIANTRMLNLLKILRHLKKDYLSIILKPSIACVQTSPLPREKKNRDKRPVYRSLFSRFFPEGGETSVHRLSRAVIYQEVGNEFSAHIFMMKTELLAVLMEQQHTWSLFFLFIAPFSAHWAGQTESISNYKYQSWCMISIINIDLQCLPIAPQTRN